MKNFLYFLGLSTLIGSMYYYFKKQLELALQYEYDVKNWKILKLNTDEAEAEIEISLSNKSSFEIEINEYDLSIFYNDIKVARTFSTQDIKVLAQQKIDIPLTANIQFKEASAAILPFFTDVLKNRPIDITISGYIKVKFLTFEHTIQLEKDKFQYSSNLLEEYGLADDVDKLKTKFKFLNKI